MPLLFMKPSMAPRPPGRGSSSPSIRCSKKGISSCSICRISALNIGQFSGFSLASKKLRLSCSSFNPWATAVRSAPGSSICRWIVKYSRVALATRRRGCPLKPFSDSSKTGRRSRKASRSWAVNPPQSSSTKSLSRSRLPRDTGRLVGNSQARRVRPAIIPSLLIPSQPGSSRSAGGG